MLTLGQAHDAIASLFPDSTSFHLEMSLWHRPRDVSGSAVEVRWKFYHAQFEWTAENENLEGLCAAVRTWRHSPEYAALVQARRDRAERHRLAAESQLAEASDAVGEDGSHAHP